MRIFFSTLSVIVAAVIFANLLLETASTGTLATFVVVFIAVTCFLEARK